MRLKQTANETNTRLASPDCEQEVPNTSNALAWRGFSFNVGLVSRAPIWREGRGWFGSNRKIRRRHNQSQSGHQTNQFHSKIGSSSLNILGIARGTCFIRHCGSVVTQSVSRVLGCQLTVGDNLITEIGERSFRQRFGHTISALSFRVAVG